MKKYLALIDQVGKDQLTEGKAQVEEQINKLALLSKKTKNSLKTENSQLKEQISKLKEQLSKEP